MIPCSFLLPSVAGRPLNDNETKLYQPYFQAQTLSQARIVEGHVPFWLFKRMCAVVIGCRIYFRAGVYFPNSIAGIELLAHELTHVEQYLTGMNVLKYLWASRVGYQQNAYEQEARAKGLFIKAEVLKAHHQFR